MSSSLSHHYDSDNDGKASAKHERIMLTSDNLLAHEYGGRKLHELKQEMSHKKEPRNALRYNGDWNTHANTNRGAHGVEAAIGDATVATAASSECECGQ